MARRNRPAILYVPFASLFDCVVIITGMPRLQIVTKEEGTKLGRVTTPVDIKVVNKSKVENNNGTASLWGRVQHGSCIRLVQAKAVVVSRKECLLRSNIPRSTAKAGHLSSIGTDSFLEAHEDSICKVLDVSDALGGMKALHVLDINYIHSRRLSNVLVSDVGFNVIPHSNTRYESRRESGDHVRSLLNDKGVSVIFNRLICGPSTTLNGSALTAHFKKRLEVGDVTVVPRISCQVDSLNSGGSVETRAVGLIQSGYSGYPSSYQKTDGDEESVAVMRRLSLPVLFVSCCLLLALALRFYANSINNERLIDWWRTALWIVRFVGSQVSGYLVLVRLICYPSIACASHRRAGPGS